MKIYILEQNDGYYTLQNLGAYSSVMKAKNRAKKEAGRKLSWVGPNKQRYWIANDGTYHYLIIETELDD